ncbi:histone acetyltransferase [Diaporthe australafricana]|uniref:Histone acetyltransferase n=1 Tax=Diaporthe australafricana TaxID=127596 RepID=A0ABR3VXZ3_9PEZI
MQLAAVRLRQTGGLTLLSPIAATASDHLSNREYTNNQKHRHADLARIRDRLQLDNKMQMDKSASQSVPDGQSLMDKRTASEEPNSSAEAKRMKTHHKSPEADANVQAKASTNNWRVPFPDKPAVLEERNGEIEFRVVNNDGTAESAIILTGLKCLFQKQLPKMPKDYIARLVYDRTHKSIAIVKKPLEVIGGISYREFRERKFAEIVFCAVSSDQQVKGYGAHLMAHLKDYVRATSPVMHFLTYADNYATGYFQKQGFTKDITLEKSVWMGYIKDYEGGTLMLCSMVPRVRYLEVGRMLLKQKETVRAKIRLLSKSHVVHQPPAQWARGVLTPIDPLPIPAIRATGWSPEMDQLARVPRHGPHFNELRRFLYQVQNHNDATTVYNKCAVKLEKYMLSLIKEIPEWFDLLEE